MQDQRSERLDDDSAEVAMWLDGDAEEDIIKLHKSTQEEKLDEETRHLMRAQQHYYDSVHAVKEPVRLGFQEGHV